MLQIETERQADYSHAFEEMTEFYKSFADQLQETDPNSGESFAKANFRNALSLIDCVGDDENIDHEQLLLSALTRGVDSFENFIDRGSVEYQFSSEIADVETFAVTAYRKEIFDLIDRFATVKRAVMLPNGKLEDDVTHSVSTALCAYHAAKMYAPELDAGDVLRNALTHDLLELITGDTPSYDKTLSQQREKADIEREAIKVFAHDFRAHPNIVKSVEEYESKISPESRFACWIDKVMPVIVMSSPCGEEHFDTLGMSPSRAAELQAVTIEKLSWDGPCPHPVCEALLQQKSERLIAKSIERGAV